MGIVNPEYVHMRMNTVPLSPHLPHFTILTFNPPGGKHQGSRSFSGRVWLRGVEFWVTRMSSGMLSHPFIPFLSASIKPPPTPQNILPAHFPSHHTHASHTHSSRSYIARPAESANTGRQTAVGRCPGLWVACWSVRGIGVALCVRESFGLSFCFWFLWGGGRMVGGSKGDGRGGELGVGSGRWGMGD